MWGGRPPADYRVDRPEVEAPRGAREPTGTNGPTLNTHINHKRLTDIHGMLVKPLYGSQPTQPPENTFSGDLSEYWLNHLVVVIAAGKRPAPIPNLEAKPASADGTAPGRVWESRTPPQHTYAGGVTEHKHCSTTPPAFLHTHTTHTRTHISPRTTPHARLPYSVSLFWLEPAGWHRFFLLSVSGGFSLER